MSSGTRLRPVRRLPRINMGMLMTPFHLLLPDFLLPCLSSSYRVFIWQTSLATTDLRRNPPRGSPTAARAVDFQNAEQDSLQGFELPKESSFRSVADSSGDASLRASDDVLENAFDPAIKIQIRASRIEAVLRAANRKQSRPAAHRDPVVGIPAIGTSRAWPTRVTKSMSVARFVSDNNGLPGLQARSKSDRTRNEPQSIPPIKRQPQRLLCRWPGSATAPHRDDSIIGWTHDRC